MATRDAPEDGFFAEARRGISHCSEETASGQRGCCCQSILSRRGAPCGRSLVRQGSRVDLRSAEEPGKILHELRSTTVHLGSTWFPPVYYGTVDATLLWVCPP